MTETQALETAAKLLAELGLAAQGWRAAISRRMRRMLGCTYFTQKRIVLSAALIRLNTDAEVDETIRHEIAHALVGPGHGHGPAWKAAAVRIGARPRACAKDARVPVGPYAATCPGCATTHTRYRRPLRGRRYHCRGCGPHRGPLAFRRIASRAT